ncbi:hypothetical protein [Candidatus Mycobacterium methanotrophicum]|uniref:AbiEi antitoxin C-terminal domain-containing protein n=1 Tax=Candidatus Mycobacterium methanotrophicum TaxID=2943498 RepID=A0ABY4QR16_9MYCO|nr:hypothetical protein [Candidatus Mycobacterium methanotrophicum]UQX12336.1 hypothetical protein M5I08_08805 [Candidatus Mycobacterium methanotrophicum]
MNDELCRLLDKQGGVVTSGQALAFLTRRSLEAELKRGGLQKVWYGIYSRGDVDARSRLRMVAEDVRRWPGQLVRRIEMHLERASSAQPVAKVRKMPSSTACRRTNTHARRRK